MRPVIVALLVALLGVTVVNPASADPRTEAAAKAAMKKAASDFKAQNYGSGATRLQKAVKACGTAKCGAPVRAALLMDLGAMQFKKGSADDAKASWAEAAKLVPGVAFDAPFDQPDLRSAFAQATAPAGGAGGGGGGGAPGGGDFTHTAPTEQTTDTPLPVYFEGGSDSVVRVVLKYRGEGMSSWKRIDLKKIGSGWGGLIPCADVQSGELRYYAQGLDDSKTPVASNGDPKHPYVVQIKSSISGPAPHLPGKEAPKSCSESSDCPPDFPGCSKSGESAGDSGDENGDSPDKGEEEEAKSPGNFKRFWIGVGTELEFMSLPSGDDLCALVPQFNSSGGTNSNAAQPVNSSHYYCTAQDGSDFPSRSSQTQNNALCTAQQVANGTCKVDGGGHADGGIVRGDLRLFVAFDYAFTANILGGARLGMTFFPYPGQAAVNDGRAFGSRFYVEGRGTYLFGKDALATEGFKPLVLAGLGVAEFDAHTSAPVALINPSGGSLITGRVNLWRTNGPFFFDLGAGVRWNATKTWALSLAARVNLSLGSNGMIPTFGPELAAQYGF